jgi:predicted methyltransferase
MSMSRKLLGSAALVAGILLLAAAAPAMAQSPAASKSGQAAVDPSRGDAVSTPAFYKTAEVIAFIGLKPGDKVADIVAGRFVRALSQAVGPTGKVYAIEPAEVVKVHPQVVNMLQGLAADPAYANVNVSTPAIDAPPAVRGLDAVFIRQNYHDLHDKFMGPADVPAFNRAVYAVLKPGGVYVVLDHAAAAGSGLSATETLHRIDEAAVKSEVEAAGFVLDAESDVLKNPADPHDKNVFDPSIRGKTDQFLLRFRKPR